MEFEALLPLRSHDRQQFLAALKAAGVTTLGERLRIEQQLLAPPAPSPPAATAASSASASVSASTSTSASSAFASTSASSASASVSASTSASSASASTATSSASASVSASSVGYPPATVDSATAPPMADATDPAAAFASAVADFLRRHPSLPPPFVLLLEMCAELLLAVGGLRRAQVQQWAVQRCHAAFAYASRSCGRPHASPLAAVCEDQGLFTNLILLMEKLVFARALRTTVEVRWARDGREEHFKYGPHESDLLAELFEPIAQAEACGGGGGGGGGGEAEAEVPSCLNPYFVSVLRGLIWSSRHLPALRETFAHAAGEEVLRPTPPVRKMVEETLQQARRAGPRFVLGVHKRVETAGTAATQFTLRIPEMAEFIEASRQALLKWAGAAAAAAPFSGCAVLLATDDAAAPAQFEAACAAGGPLHGARLVCRRGVKRTLGGTTPDGVLNEVHLIEGTTLADAYDALADGLCLAGCEGMVHIDSSVAFFAALRSPELKLHHAGALLSPFQPVVTRESERLVVVHEPCVFLRAQPSIASAALGTLPKGTVVSTSGRWSGDWAELATPKGWVLTDASNTSVLSEAAVNRKNTQIQGRLLVPAE